MISNLKFQISNAGLPAAWAADKSVVPPAAVPANQAPMTDIHDIKSVLDMGADWGWLAWGLMALAVIALALLAWWFWRRRRVKTEGPLPEPEISPEAEAYAFLDKLTADGSTDAKRFYFQLSAILRRYMERRYHFPAAEMTVEELLPRVERLPLPQDLVQPFKDFSGRSEPIKFAGTAADGDGMSRDLAFGRDFVKRTTPAESVQPAAALSEATDLPWVDRISAAHRTK